MKRIFVTLIFSAVLLSGCNQNSSEMVTDLDFKARTALLKIEALEKRVNELEKKRVSEASQSQPIKEPIEKKNVVPQNRFMLVGPRTMAGSGTEFPSLERCENARASLIQQSLDRANRERERGIITLGEPLISCMPL